MSSDAWPVVFITWQSKIKETVEDLHNGRLHAQTPLNLHARKDADFLVVSETGLVLAVGTIDQVSGDNYGLFLIAPIPNPDTVIELSRMWLTQLLDFCQTRLSGPVTAWVVPPNGRLGLDKKWFQDVYRFATKAYLPEKGKNVAQELPSPVSAAENISPQPESDKEAVLTQWLPPILTGLLADRVRADKWEMMVAAAFRALGCHVKMFGYMASGRAEPDCIASYTSPAGQIIEILIDAKAGSWNGSIDDIRAMRDYHATANPYTFPLFVANSLGKDVSKKLQENTMKGKVPKAITGYDLALLIVQRLARPNFDLEQELRNLLL